MEFKNILNIIPRFMPKTLPPNLQFVPNFSATLITATIGLTRTTNRLPPNRTQQATTIELHKRVSSSLLYSLPKILSLTDFWVSLLAQHLVFAAAAAVAMPELRTLPF